MNRAVVIEIPALTWFVRMVFWYYVILGTVYVIKGVIKYAIVSAAAFVVGTCLAWALTTSPRPFHLDLLDPYLQPFSAFSQPQYLAPARPMIVNVQQLPFRED